MRTHATLRPLSLLGTFAAALLLVGIAGAAPAFAAGGCPNETVRGESNTNPMTSQPYSLGLPECRAYEMVSPPEKGGSSALSFQVTPDGGFPVAADGDAVGFLSQNAFGDAETAVSASFGSAADSYIARRATSGWVTSSALAPRGLVGKPALNPPDASSGDLSTVVNCGLTLVNNATAGSGVVCATRSPAGSWLSTSDYSNLTGKPYADFTGNSTISFVGSSSELNHVVFESDGGAGAGAALLPADTSTEKGDGLYEVAGLGGSVPELRLVNVDDSDSEIGPDEGSKVGGIGSDTGGAVSCEPHASNPGVSSDYHAISADGQTIYFTGCPSNEAGGVNEIYARIAGTSTVAISSPSPSQCTTCDPTPASAAFEGASADGSKAFFLTGQQLANGDIDTTADLYEYDFDNPPGKNVVQLSTGGAGDLTPGSGAEVQGVVRTSSDGSHAYFVANGVLTTVPDAAGEVAQAGADNLYVVDTASDETKFVADLCSDASLSGSVSDPRCPASLNGTTFEGRNDIALWGCLSCQSGRMAQTTPDGRYLVFTTYARLSIDGPEADTNEAQQVYRYDVETGKLARISIGEPSFPASNNGNTPGMGATITPLQAENVTGGVAGALADVNDWARAVSDSGATIVFSTPQRLQADDVDTGINPSCGGDGTTGCDVYEWHECESARCDDGMEGEVSMISPGDDPTSNETIDGVAGMSASGSDIFFFTRTPLVGQDTDQLIDVYDARIDGGFPAPSAESSCSGEACQGTPSSVSTFDIPGTQSFTGGGNLTPGSTAFHPPVQETKPKPLTRTQMLTKALKNCKKNKSKAKRKSCETQTRHKYAPSKHKATKKH